MTAQHPVLFVIQNGRYERAFEHGVFAIEGEQAFGIERLGAFVPLAIHPLAVSPEIARRALVARFTHSVPPSILPIQPRRWTKPDASGMMEICVVSPMSPRSPL